MKTPTRLLVLIGLAAAALGVLGAPAHAAVTISAGHVDALDIDWIDNGLAINLLDGTVTPAAKRNPADVILEVGPAAKTTVPSDSRYAFLGNPGDPVWILPQTQHSGILWLGWNTEEIPTGNLIGDTVLVTLTSAAGPGDVSVYSTNSFGAPTILLDSGDGLPDSFNVATNTHQHANWAFESAGDYTLAVQVTGTRATDNQQVGATATYTFRVQP